MVSTKFPDTRSATGTFDHTAIASGRRFDAREFVENTPVLGLEREAGYIWGTLRDDEGTLYSTMRRIAATPPEATADGRQSLGGKHIVVSSGTGEPGLHLRREPRGAVDSAHISATLTDEDTVTYASAPGVDGRPMRLRFSEDDFSYSEADVLEASGYMVAPPLQWFLPGRDAALLYITQTFLVDGIIAGRPMRGFLFWEEAWMYPGGRLYRDKDPLHDAEYLTWYSWANHYDDGSCEIGHFLFGQQNYHVGVTAHSDGTVTSARQMDAVITRAPDGHWHDGISYELDGVRWVCEPDPEGHMRGLGPMPNPQQEGRIHRVDDLRVPDVWMAWGETVPGNGNARRR
ncbi:hypothetical protein [Mycobacterium sp. M26]|uniref:hypothetical protein n=1 Tax=Mycobacterium sp. M26 TaxID=1762962 RepID=UPI00073FA363|nr:hypothetical protein [Mycobacterium sp. M26]